VGNVQLGIGALLTKLFCSDGSSPTKETRERDTEKVSNTIQNKHICQAVW
jgi:hypothetical protein